MFEQRAKAITISGGFVVEGGKDGNESDFEDCPELLYTMDLLCLYQALIGLYRGP